MIRKILLFLLFAASVSAQANRVVVVDGGKVKMQGSLVNGGCSVASESQDLTVQMGQYKSSFFKEVGNYAPVSIPFAIHLTDCDTEISDLVGISFQGVTPEQDPQVFLAATRIGEIDSSSGIGLALFDSEQKLIIPNAAPGYFVSINEQETTLHFTARYRSVTQQMTPGNIHSDVWFTLIYP
jgi:fimbrial protein